MRKKIDEQFLKYWGLSGAKACKSCRSRQELSNEYFLAKFVVDTEENEPCKVCSFGWKIRERFGIEPYWFFLSQMIKLCRARSLLYRRQILQENIRWKALDEIYTIYMLLHRSDLNISASFRQNVSRFLVFFRKIRLFSLFFALNLAFLEITEHVAYMKNEDRSLWTQPRLRAQHR